MWVGVGTNENERRDYIARFTFDMHLNDKVFGRYKSFTKILCKKAPGTEIFCKLGKSQGRIFKVPNSTRPRYSNALWMLSMTENYISFREKQIILV